MHIKVMICLLMMAAVNLPQSKAQDIFSPLSTQGLGKIRGRQFTPSMGMGGLSIALMDSTHFNLVNPATSSALTYTVFDLGVKLGYNRIRTHEAEGSYDDFGLNYAALGFPISKKLGWTAAFGILPYSAVGYNTSIEFNDTSRIETHTFKGGIADLFLNSAIRLHENLTFGVQGSFLFGNRIYEHNIQFPGSTDLANVLTRNNYLIRGFAYRAGLVHQSSFNLIRNRKLKDGKSVKDTASINMNFGLYATSSIQNRALLSRYGVSFFTIGNSVSVPDTVIARTRTDGRFRLPTTIGSGIVFSKMDRWKLGVDVEYAQWASFDFPGIEQELFNQLDTRIGMSYIPDNESTAPYLSRVEYRLGGSVGQSFVNLNGTQLNKFSTTFGLSLPMKRRYSRVNISFEYGSFGNLDRTILSEDYFNIYLGFTIDEKWFRRRKIN